MSAAGYERRFFAIDDNPVNAENVVGYCRHYKGVLTTPLCNTHKCRHKYNGCPCSKLILLAHIDTPKAKECPHKGEAYREQLKKKGKHGKNKR